MLNFNEENYLSVLNGAVHVRSQIEKIADEVSAAGYKNVFLIGSGGTIALKYPLEYILKTNSDIPVYAEIAAEFIVMDHQRLNEKSLVVLSSLSGTTEETVAAAKFAKKQGATTIGFVGEENTPLANETKYTVINHAANDTLCEEMHIQLYTLIFRLMHLRGEFPEYEALMEDLEKLPYELVLVKERTERKAEEFALKYKDETYHMIVGSGNLWGETYLYGMCVLEEMQWIRTKTIHAAEFFHGTIELVEEDTSVILLYGEDSTRPLMDRVGNFVNRYTKEITIFDTKDYELNGIREQFRGFFSPIVMAALLERVSVHLEEKRNHPLTTRRYYRVVQY
ncbi:SIS domain-containing protein [Neobacillus cucumis]|uniref:SIS domain-containing protein n=1 Tax=Neobacillus cucumis TaxID=1740721 RepID=UPI00203F5694|nr:SIS domain-containing protein [Neobacillus cucumis]MCM3728635.1 SIS domain-containing protein [Neobacillus cucumis]